VALYVGATPSPATLLLTTAAHLPLTGHVARSDVTVGGDTWLALATAREPLAGALLDNVPWLLGLAVLLIGLAMAALVEAVSRRRDYALGLVAERTTALQHSLGELERAQQALVENERLAALGQMAATVGHELRNPLGVLTNALYLIRTAVSATADDRLHRQLDTADREISAATLIVSDLLEFSRPRAANPVPVDVTELLAEAVSVAPPPSGIEVAAPDAADSPDLTPVVADRDQLRQVVLNLLTNAYEAMPTGGTVRLAARAVAGDGEGAGPVGAGAVEITVSDTGTGMDEQTRERVFEPFFSQKTKGTGLGLAVSKRIVEQHGGTLSLASQPGRGCTAVVRLPGSPVPTATTAEADR
jgi:signal transduction histidine kinase